MRHHKKYPQTFENMLNRVLLALSEKLKNDIRISLSQAVFKFLIKKNMQNLVLIIYSKTTWPTKIFVSFLRQFAPGTLYHFQTLLIILSVHKACSYLVWGTVPP